MSFRTRFARPAAAVLALALAALSFLLTPAPVRAQAAPGVKVSVLHAAHSPSTLTVGPDGSLFGTEADYRYPSTLFKVTLGGLFHSLIEFNGDNGASPSGGPLLPMPDGSFFGSTMYGGKSGTGLLFRFTPKRRYQIKHEFAPADASGLKNVRGAYPEQPMVLGEDGAVYAVTLTGGSTGGGIIFRYTETKGVEVVHEFAAVTHCYSGITRGPDGALYGTFTYGGPNETGQIFRSTTTGGFTVLHTFTGADGIRPDSPPVVGPDGALYGTTSEGGLNGEGVAYRVTPDGDFTLLHSFASRDGAASPRSGLVVGPDGKFYGKAFTVSGAVLYRLAAAGTVTVLYQAPDSDLYAPTTPMFGRDNRLYVSGFNNIYKVTVPF